MAEGYHGVHEKLVDRFGTKGDALYTFAACGLALAVSGLAAWLFKQPLLFPSLGPTALLFFEQSLAAPSSPRNTLIGHLVAILAGAPLFSRLRPARPPEHPRRRCDARAHGSSSALAGTHRGGTAAPSLLPPADRSDDLDRKPGALADAAGDGHADGRCRNTDHHRVGHKPCTRGTDARLGYRRMSAGRVRHTEKERRQDIMCRCCRPLQYQSPAVRDVEEKHPVSKH